MANRDAILEAMGMLAAAHPRVTILRATVEVYCLALADVPYEELRDAVRLAIKMHGDNLEPEDIAAIKRELRGKTLACLCPLPKPGEPDICHAALLLKLANKETP